MKKFYNPATGITVYSSKKDFTSVGYVAVDGSIKKKEVATESFSLSPEKEVEEEIVESHEDSLSDLIPSLASAEAEEEEEIEVYGSYREIQHNAEKVEGARAMAGDTVYEFDGSRWKKAQD